MIFSHGLHDKVLKGTKSETRRPVKPDESHCRYRVEHEYGVQGKHGGPALGRIRILAVSCQRLGDISPESVKREGFKTREEFEAFWAELYGSFDPDCQVWALVFVPTEEKRFLGPAGYVSGTFKAMGATTARPDHWAEADPRGSQARRFLREPEPEAVDAETQNRFSAKAEEENDRRREVMRSRLAQMRQVGIEHLKAGVDVDTAFDRAYEQVRGREAA